MIYSWLVIAPPLLVILATLTTRHIIFSFLVGIICSTLLITQGNITAAGWLTITRLWENTGLQSLTSWSSFWASWNLLIFLFLLCLGILIVLLKVSGSAQAFTTLAQSRVKNRRSAEQTSLILSLFFFIDDYFSTLTVGSIMQPLARACSVPAVKSAFLVTAMASSLTIISPISSWVGEIVLQLRQAGVDENNPASLINADPLFVYVHSIPFIVYSFFLIICTWYIVMRRISFGPMAAHEHASLAKPLTPPDQKVPSNASIFDFLLPILTLIISIVTVLLFTGKYTLFGGQNSLAQAFKDSAPNQAFFIGGIISVTVTMAWLLMRKKITLAIGAQSVYEGIWLMLPSIVMLVHAWTLGSFLKQDLHTGAYVAHIFSSLLTPTIFPLLCFIFSALIAWMIGSAWATMGLMFPLVFDMLKVIYAIAPHSTLEHAMIILPIIGATLSGCIAGTHLSLISDNPIMSSVSTGANHVEHVKTMAWYLLPVIVGTATTYTLIGIFNFYGLEQMLGIAYLLGLSIAIAILELCNWYGKKTIRMLPIQDK